MAEPTNSTAHTVPAEVWRARFPMTDEQVREFCAKWRIVELGLFGSILRDDWDEAEPTEVMVAFEAGVHWPFGGFGEITDELEELTGLAICVATKGGLETSSRQHERDLTRVRMLHAA